MFSIVKVEKNELPIIKDYGFFEKESHNVLIVGYGVNQDFIKDLDLYVSGYTNDIIATLNSIGSRAARQKENQFPFCFRDIRIVSCNEKGLAPIINWNKRNPNLFEKMTILCIKN